MTQTTRLPPDKCPHCGYYVDSAEDAQGEGVIPKADDATLCINCGEWCIFDANLKLRKPTDDEFIEINRDPIGRKIQYLWAKEFAPERLRRELPDG